MPRMPRERRGANSERGPGATPRAKAPRVRPARARARGRGRGHSSRRTAPPSGSARSARSVSSLQLNPGWYRGLLNLLKAEHPRTRPHQHPRIMSHHLIHPSPRPPSDARPLRLTRPTSASPRLSRHPPPPPPPPPPPHLPPSHSHRRRRRQPLRLAGKKKKKRRRKKKSCRA